MKYVSGGTFTTEEFSIDETITELNDVIDIARITIKNISSIPDDVKKDLKFAIQNLEEAEYYLPYIRKKVKKALKYVPEDVQEKEHL